MRAVRYYVGTEFDKDNKPIKDIEKKTVEVKRLVALAFGGSTMFNGDGSWQDNNKDIVNEKALTVEVLTGASDKELRKMAGILRDVFNQESVLMTTQRINSEFV